MMLKWLSINALPLRVDRWARAASRPEGNGALDKAAAWGHAGVSPLRVWNTVRQIKVGWRLRGHGR